MRDKETGLFIKNAFEELGHNVVVNYDPKEMPITQIVEQAMNVINKIKIDLVFMSRTPQLVTVLRAIKTRFGNKAPLVTFWNVDAEDNINRWRQLYPLMHESDFWFTKARGSIQAYKNAELGDVHWLPQGIDNNTHNTPFAETLAQQRWEHDVSFLGAMDEWHEDTCDRTNVITAIINGGFDLNTKPAYGEKASEVYYRTKINIGSNHFPKVSHAMSVRDFKVMGAGGFLLTNYVKDMEEFFIPGVDLATYRTPAECVSQTKYYLEHEEERMEIALNGYEKVHANHTYAHRMQKVIDLVRKLKGESKDDTLQGRNKQASAQSIVTLLTRVGGRIDADPPSKDVVQPRTHDRPDVSGAGNNITPTG